LPTVELSLWKRLFSHVLKKIFKGLFPPIADGDTATSVILVKGTVWITATSDDPKPRIMLGSPRSAVSPIDAGLPLSAKTSATADAPVSKTGRICSIIRSARAYASDSGAILLVESPICGDDKAPENSARLRCFPLLQRLAIHELASIFTGMP
jgi:hypothetical protein